MLVITLGLAACGSNLWISPMLSFNLDEDTTTVWSGDTLHRFETGNFVFGNAATNEAITEQALLDGGAIQATVNFAYEGDGTHYIRFAAFTYIYFDHGRPIQMPQATMAERGQGVIVLWRNPANNNWFNIRQNPIGSNIATGSTAEVESLRTGNPNPVIRIDRNTTSNFSTIELFIIPISRPTRDTAFTRTGYVINFAVETPDFDNHFHGFEILASSKTAIVVD